MNKIDYQALREAAEKATWGDWDSYKPHRGARGYEVRLSSQAIAQHVLKNNAEFIAAFNPKIALALLDERERNQQYIKSRDQENEDIALTVGKLRVELEAEEKTSAARLEALDRTHKMFQREQCRAEAAEKRIAELEKSEEQLINERDHAESALADMYFAATGNRPEWSNWFGFSDAVDAVVDRIADLEAKQPSPVVPDNASESLAYAYKELTPEIMRGHIAVFERYGIAPNDSSTTIQALRIALTSLEAEPIAWRYRYVKKGVTDFQGKQWAGDWIYVPTKEDCNDRPNYEIQALFTAPPVPVTSEGLVKAVRFYEQVKRENPPVETGAWKDAIDWVLKEVCQVVNTGIKGD